MATRPKQFRAPGQLGRAAAQRAYDAERREASDTRRLYSTAAWRAIRAAQLRAEPLCKFCLDRGLIVSATVCDHVEPHRGDVDRFWSGPFQSLCKPCHDTVKQRQEAASP